MIDAQPTACSVVEDTSHPSRSFGPSVCHYPSQLTNPLPCRAASGSGDHEGPAASLPAGQAGASGALRVSPAGAPVERPRVPAAGPAILRRGRTPAAKQTDLTRSDAMWRYADERRWCDS